MSKGLLFWIIFILALLFGLWAHWGSWYVMGGSLIEYVLIGLLGWHCFGAPVQ